jgi:hypothetical protein
MSATRKKFLAMGIAVTLFASVILAVLFCCTRSAPRVVGDLTPSDVRDLQRMTRSLRTRDYRSPHPYASLSPVRKLLYRVRGATARMDVMERPSVVPSMAYSTLCTGTDSIPTTLMFTISRLMAEIGGSFRVQRSLGSEVA